MRKIDKRGAEMTVTTIVVIALALLVLVLLALGFTGGWNNLWSRISNLFTPGANVDTIKQACGLACSLGNNYDFCTVERDVRLKKGDALLDLTGINDVAIDKNKMSIKGSCNAIADADALAVLAIEKCGAIQCAKTCAELGGSWGVPDNTPGNVGNCPANKEKITAVTDSATNAGKICCKASSTP